MAGEAGQTSSDLKQQLLTKGHEFSFVQALRLLRLIGASAEISDDPADYRTGTPVRIRPNNSLSFPPADITAIENIEGEEPGFRITANFLGLYGHSSPLPTFYTEELLDEANADESVSRDFLDIFNHRLFTLFYRCCLKYNIFFQVMDEGNNAVIERLFCLLGLGDPQLRKGLEITFPLCRYIGLITQYPHSAWGLETMLQDAFRGARVEVIQCFRRTVKIRPDQRLSIGFAASRLGEDSVLGSEIEDRTGKFRVRIDPVRLHDFNLLLPENPNYEKLVAIIDFYKMDPLECDVELILAKDECIPVSLGDAKMSRLGLDTWIFSSATIGEVSAIFPLS